MCITKSYYIANTPATLIRPSRQEHDALWRAITAVIHAHLEWAGPVILEGWQLDPDRVTSLTHPQLRACWLSVDDAVLEARLRADTAFYQGAGDAERSIQHYLARSGLAHDRVRRAAVHAASWVIHVGPEETGDALVTRCVQRLWPR
jgi:hypothetical protein